MRFVLSKSLCRHSAGRSKGNEDGRIRGLESSDGGTEVGTLIEGTRAIGVYGWMTVPTTVNLPRYPSNTGNKLRTVSRATDGGHSGNRARGKTPPGPGFITSHGRRREVGRFEY